MSRQSRLSPLSVSRVVPSWHKVSFTLTRWRA